MKYLIFLFSFSLYSFSFRPFESDGCTFIIDKPIFSKNKSFKPCCYYHDISYWIGGSKQQRKSSDKELRKCVKKASNGFYGSMFYFGVRTGHLSPIKSKYRWGWGREDKKFTIPSKYILNNAKKVFNSNQVDMYLEQIYRSK